MFCIKCEARDFNILTGVKIGPSRGVSGVTKSWTLYECKTCGFYKLITEETNSEEAENGASKENT